MPPFNFRDARVQGITPHRDDAPLDEEHGVEDEPTRPWHERRELLGAREANPNVRADGRARCGGGYAGVRDASRIHEDDGGDNDEPPHGAPGVSKAVQTAVHASIHPAPLIPSFPNVGCRRQRHQSGGRKNRIEWMGLASSPGSRSASPEIGGRLARRLMAVRYFTKAARANAGTAGPGTIEHRQGNARGSPT